VPDLDKTVFNSSLFKASSVTFSAMFKGILPSKRETSEFTMMTPLLDSNGKENFSGVGAPPSAAQKGTKSALVAASKARTQEKKKRGDAKQGNETRGKDVEGPGMDQAFDRLLVCALPDNT
jgi:hypothetical protein